MTKRVKRRIACLPNAVYFKPRCIPVCDLEVVEITLNELEAARLIDLESLEQEEAAHKMGCECLNARIACIDGTPRLALEGRRGALNATPRNSIAFTKWRRWSNDQFCKEGNHSNLIR